MVLVALATVGCVEVFDEPEVPEESIAPTSDAVVTPEATPSPTPEPTAEPIPPAEPTPDPSPVAPPPATPSEPAAPPPPPPPVAEPPPASPPPPPPPPPATPPPSATPPPPTPEPAPWPREGSHVAYASRSGWSVPDGSAYGWTYTNTTWTYSDGDWHGACVYTTSTWDGDSWDHDAGTERYSASSPPHWPLFNTRDPPPVGGQVEVWHLWDCRIDHATMVYSGVEATNYGPAHTADDERIAEENYSDYNGYWDPDTGLVLEWQWARRASSTNGHLTSTDAPI